MKLTNKSKFGYASASFGDAAAYTFIGTFLMFFLTTVVKISPVTAGTITAIGSIWDTLWSPVAGYWSDHCRSKMGKRRPFMMFAAFPIAAATCLLFTSIDASESFRAVYYGVMVIVFWLAFSTFFVPYLALGADFTDDYNERTVLRSYAYGFNLLGLVAGMVLPTVIVDFLCSRDLSIEGAWQITAAFVGACSAISIYITVAVSKGKDLYIEEIDDGAKKKKFTVKSFGGIFMEYLDVLKLKPIQCMIGASIFYLIAYAMYTADRLYFFTYNMGLSAGEISALMIATVIVGVIYIPIVTLMSKKLDKRSVLIIMLLLSAVFVSVAKITGIGTMEGMILFIFVVGIGNGTYWQLMPSMIYDVCEYDELETGNKRKGSIVSLQSLSEALATAMGMELLGIILQLAGFNGEAAVQTPSALDWIESAITVIPAALMVGAAVMIYKYPITKKSFEEICGKLKEKDSAGR